MTARHPRTLADLDPTTREGLGLLVDELQRHFAERFVSLAVYGSRARGDHREESDLDVFAVVDGLPRNRRERFDSLRPVRTRFEEWCRGERGQETPYLSLITKSKEEAAYRAPLYLDMTEDAIIVHDRGGFFEGVLDGVRRRLRELGSKRVFIPGGWYWVLKPDMSPGECVEMTTHGMALKAFRQAAYRLQLVQKALADSEWATVVRESQEVVELALKALLRYLGVEPPRWHDVAAVLRAEAKRLPAGLAGDLDALCTISASLRADRELSFYGDETRQLAPDDLYDESDARPAFESARFVVERVTAALGNLTRSEEEKRTERA